MIKLLSMFKLLGIRFFLINLRFYLDISSRLSTTVLYELIVMYIIIYIILQMMRLAILQAKFCLSL